MMLTGEQRCVFRRLLKHVGKDQTACLGGFAGTGKTTVLAALAEALPSFACVAFTGKAANVLRKRGMPNARTIHSTIYFPSIDANGRSCWLLKTPDELDCQGFLVDEASMVSRELCDDLLSFGRSIIFVGDHGQLPPINSDFNLMEHPDCTLEKIHRNAGEIAHFAEHLRKGQSPWRFDGKDRVLVLEVENVSDALLTDVDQVIVAFNKTRCSVNQRIRDLHGRMSLLEVGERVMCLRNTRELGLFNGMQGTVDQVHPDKPVLDFVSDGETHRGIVYDEDQFGQERHQFSLCPDDPVPFDYAYAITAHKAQGDEWDDVLVFEERCDWWDHRRWAYTAASRARRSLIWVAAATRRFVPAVGRLKRREVASLC